MSGKSSQEREPRLLLSDGQKAEYVTLSHCWGKSQPLVTNSKTMEQHLRAIPFKILPKAFQDAVTATRRLGYSYLWIDSLCIIQGSKEDWEIECSKMANIYRNSTVTIVGAAAGDCHTGFLQRRIPTQPIPDVVEWKSKSGPCPQKFAIRWDRHQGPQPCDQASPSEKRGWILQERLLSPRVLYFGAHRMYWKCSTSEWFEDCSLTEPRKDRAAKRDFSVEQDPKYKWNLWCKIVEEYSKLSLTDPMDKLPAISGMASSLLHGDHNEYLAGIIKSDLQLHVNLTWHIERESQYPELGESSGLDPARIVSLSSYRAPSWSWASVDQRVSFFSTRRHEYPRRISSSTLKLIEARIGRESKDTFGKASSACLKVEGKMKLGMMLNSSRFKFNTNERHTVDFYADNPELHNDENTTHSHCLCFLEEGGGFRGLALVQLDTNSKRYRRVGCFFFPASTNFNTEPWFMDVERKQFELI